MKPALPPAQGCACLGSWGGQGGRYSVLASPCISDRRFGLMALGSCPLVLSSFWKLPSRTWHVRCPLSAAPGVCGGRNTPPTSQGGEECGPSLHTQAGCQGSLVEPRAHPLLRGQERQGPRHSSSPNSPRKTRSQQCSCSPPQEKRGPRMSLLSAPHPRRGGKVLGSPRLPQCQGHAQGLSQDSKVAMSLLGPLTVLCPWWPCSHQDHQASRHCPGSSGVSGLRGELSQV